MSARKSRPEHEHDVVGHVGKTPAVHAEGMRSLVGVGINVRQGEPVAAMRVDFELSCGTSSLTINGGRFVLSLRACFVDLALDNCEVRPQTRYESRLVVGSVEATATETHERSDDSEFGGGVDASVQVGATAPVPAPRFGGLLKANKNRKAAKAAHRVVKRRARIDLVVTAGQDRWQVGDPSHGDARRDDGRLAGSYFGEERDEDGEAKPLCVVAAMDPGSTSTVTVSAIARAAQLLVHLDGEAATPGQREDVEASLEAEGRRVALRHKKQERDLRARMAGLVLGNAIGAAQRGAGLPVEDGEVLLARQTLVTTPRRVLKAPG